MLTDTRACRGLGIEADCTATLQAFGYEMPGCEGYGMNATASVYDSNNRLLTSSSANGGVFGWESSAAISRVMTAADFGAAKATSWSTTMTTIRPLKRAASFRPVH